MAPVGKHRCLPSERAPWRAALGMPIVLLLASCASTDRGELQRLADSAAGAIGASGGFLQVCDKQSEGCERWAPLFVQTVGESMYALSSSPEARAALSDNGVVRACAGVSALIESSLGTERQVLLKQLSFTYVRNEALKLHEMLGQERERRGMSSRVCVEEVPPSSSSASVVFSDAVT